MQDAPPRLARWRAELREDATATRQRRALARAAEALAQAADAAHAAEAVLRLAAELAGARDAAVLARGASGVRLLAGLGAARPAGATVPGGTGWRTFSAGWTAPSETGPGHDEWLLPGTAAAGTEWRGGIRFAGQALGALVLRLPDPGAEGLDETLCAFAALLAPCLAPVSSARRPRRRQDSALRQLTPRERQVLALLPRGLSNQGLADALGIAPGTAKSHVERILRKLECRDRTQAAVMAVEGGLSA
ncbi:helix-turn-helix transcriptional regulator [Arenimonas sp.]|uniref:helix-turn-helix transcriptional regulator n=1 Tax=Arenimonas sp. TaxID=1872635 RepID=UPI002E30A05E|nr:LuxR C-terminal-related transcriptional regulator [Arenimonas sp.]HEX4854049.1 LuxR C-terminal-related transcriptional regulator [Arenimonas sp.]